MKECSTCRRCFPDHFNNCPTDGDALMHSIPGEPVLDGRYQLEQRLGQGGMGVVYRARHIFLKTAHAIKVILPDLVGNDPMLVTRFRQEAMAAAAIRHQNIIAVTDFGVSRGTMPFLVMEYVKGQSLHDVLAEQGRLQPENALEIMTGIASGVGAAHKQGIVHRDLKPLNIMLQEGMTGAESVKVLDFGLAKIKSGELLGSFVAAQTTGLMGSPFYMAPEQWSEEEPDKLADVYSLGVILYQMLAGDVPFKGPTIPSIMKKHLMEPPPAFSQTGAPNLPVLEQVVNHALEKDPHKRPATVEDFLGELRQAVKSLQAQTAHLPDNQAATMMIPAAQLTADMKADEERQARERAASEQAERDRKERERQEREIQAREQQEREQAEQQQRARAEQEARAERERQERQAREAREAEDARRAEEARLANAVEAERRRAAEEQAKREEEQRRWQEVQRLKAEEEARQQQAAQHAAAQQAEQERLRREQQERELQAQREQAQREQAQREQAQREQYEREQRERQQRELSTTSYAPLPINSVPPPATQQNPQANNQQANAGAPGAQSQSTIYAPVPPAANANPQATMLSPNMPQHQQGFVSQQMGGTSLAPGAQQQAVWQQSQPSFNQSATHLDTGAPKKSQMPLLLGIGAVVVLLPLIGGGIYLATRSSTPTVNGGDNTNVVVANNNTNGGNTNTQPGGTNPTGATKANVVDVPGGDFQMGQNGGAAQASPAHAASVKPFSIDRTEVTNAEYAEFVRETKHPAPTDWTGNAPPAGKESFPVTNVSLDDATAFAKWRSKRDGVTYRLPTEEEWEFAARGKDAQLFPWGNAWDATRANLGTGSTSDQPKAVGSYPNGRSPFGADDMIGNVWEWTTSEASVYPGNSSLQLPANERGSIVVRGGSYSSMGKESVKARGGEPLPAAFRQWVPRQTKNATLGFRLVKAN